MSSALNQRSDQMLRLATKFRPVPSHFDTATAAGFRNAEFFLDRDVLDDPTGVIETAREYDLGYALHFPNKPELEVAHLEAVARLYDELSASAVVIHPHMLRQYGEQMRSVHSDIALAEETMRVAPDEFPEWLEAHDHVTLDVEHIWKFSLNDGPIEELFRLVESIFASHGDRVRHIHMPGYLPGYGEHRPMYTSREFCFGIFDILASNGYEHLVVSEVDLEFQNAAELRMDVLLFERWEQQRKNG